MLTRACSLQNVAPPAAPTDEAWKKRTNKLFKKVRSPVQCKHATKYLLVSVCACACCSEQVDTSEEDAGVPNVLEEASFFEWAGIGFPKEQLYRLFLAMTQLKTLHGLKGVRFFGKILGTQRDYYIVEGTYTVPPAAATADGVSVPAEAPGTGLNACAYFVTSDPSDPFVLLPDVEPSHVVAACLVKKYFTGDLDAPVRCYPPFPGSEKVYLRAQIARIAAATVLVPAGKFKIDEEGGEGGAAGAVVQTPADEYESKAAAEMVEADNWSHLSGGILKIGRCTNPPKPEPAEGDEEVQQPMTRARG